MMESTGLKDILSSVDLVITGEGQIDEQTLHGKVVNGIAQAALLQDVPVIAICGSSKLSHVPNGISRVYDLISLAGNKEKSMSEAEELLKTLSAQAITDYLK